MIVLALDVNTCGYCTAWYRFDTCQLIALLMAIAAPSREDEILPVLRYCSRPLVAVHNYAHCVVSSKSNKRRVSS